jgi:adenosylcobinamide-phosphate synthase
MSLPAAGAVALAALLDRLVGELPTRVHPVALFGRLVTPFDREWRFPRLVGALVALVLPLSAAALVGGLVTLAGGVGPLAAAPLAGVALFVTTSLRMLLDEARAVVDLADEDLPAARDRLRSLAGRDADALDAGLVRSAAVESAAENLADGLVAPLSAFALGALVGLPVAAAAAAWVKAVNTLDSMLGYPGKPHGTASARLDDAVMWLPARLAAGLIAVAVPDPETPWRARRWVARVDSPNSGWPMGTLAAALGARLEKPGAYVLNDVGRLPDGGTARRGVSLVARAGWLAWLFAAVALLSRVVG